MTSFWDDMRNREPKVTSREELLSAWTQNVEEIQQELVAAQIQREITEAVDDVETSASTQVSQTMTNGAGGAGDEADSVKVRPCPTWITLDLDPSAVPISPRPSLEH